MSNGAACCALEICCPPGEAQRKRVSKMIAAATGGEEAYGLAVLDWMEQEGLTFAPASFRDTIAEIVASVRKHAPTEPAA